MEVCDPRVGVSYVTVIVIFSSGLPADRERNEGSGIRSQLSDIPRIDIQKSHFIM